MSDSDTKPKDIKDSKEVECAEVESEVENNEKVHVEDEKFILYYETFSNFSSILIEVFSGTSIKLVKLEDIGDIYDYTNNIPCLLVTDIPLEVGFNDEFVELNDYINCPKIFIFESFEELSLCQKDFSKFNILGLVKDGNLKERIISYLSILELSDEEDLFFQMDNIQIESSATIVSSIKSLCEKTISLGSPNIYDFKEFKKTSMYLPHFHCRFDFSSERSRVEEDELCIERNNSDLIEQLKTFGFESVIKHNVAYIADNPPRFHAFKKLDIKINYYKSYDDYQGDEEIIIVEDKKISNKLTSGMEICKTYNNYTIIFSRLFPTERYKGADTDKVNATTSIFDLNIIKNMIENYKSNNPIEDSFIFDHKNDLSSVEIQTHCRIKSISETLITIELPFKISEASQVKIDYFGDTYLTAIDCEGLGEYGFLIEFRTDGFHEKELNKIRQSLNKMYFLESKDVELHNFKTIDEVISYEYVDKSEE